MPHPQLDEKWDEDFDALDHIESSETPPSSSAVLFARLTKPRVGDRDDPGTTFPNTLREKRLRRGVPDVLHSTISHASADSAHHAGPDPNPPANFRCDIPISMDEDIDEDPNADLSYEDAPVESGTSCSASASELAYASVDKFTRGHSGHVSRLQEMAYRFADTGWSVALIFLLILLDASFFFLEIVFLHAPQIPQAFMRSYTAMDCITAVAYMTEVNMRLFSYSPTYFFRSRFRSMDYFICMANFAVVVASISIAAQPFWLDIMRFVRVFRLMNIVILTRERRLKGQAFTELQEVAVLLDLERSDKSRLVKWRIDSSAIAVGEEAGQGGFGSVFLGLFRGTLVAVKQLYGSNAKATSYASVEDEAITLVNLRHPNVVLFMGFVHEPSKLWIVTEYCSRGSLRDLLDRDDFLLTASKILKFALGAARGLAYLHGQDPPVLHLDLKSSNILISSGWETKLADFGLSRNMHNIQNNTFAGTVQYSAPEILESNSFTVAADIYSFGVCMWEMAARKIPFEGTPPIQLLWGVVKEGMRPPLDCIRMLKAVTTEKPSSASLQHADDIVCQEPHVGLASMRIGTFASCSTSTTGLVSTDSQTQEEIPSGEHQVGDGESVTENAPVQPRFSLSNSPTILDEEVKAPIHYTKRPVGFERYFVANQAIHEENLTSPVTPSEPSTLSSQKVAPSANSQAAENATGAVESLETVRPLSALCGNGSPAQVEAGEKSAQENRSAQRLNQSSPHAPEFYSTPRAHVENEEHSERHQSRRSILESLGLAISIDPKFEKTDNIPGISMASITSGDPSNGGLRSFSPSRHAHGSLDQFASCVTAKLQLFDDLPSVAKRAPIARVPATFSEVVNSTKVLEAFGLRKTSDGLSTGANGSAKGLDGLSPHRVDRRSSYEDTFQRRMHSFSTMPPTSSKGNYSKSQEHRGELAMAVSNENWSDNHFPGHCKQGPVRVPDEFVALIEQCWEKDPSRRPNADEVVWRLVSMIDCYIRDSDNPVEQ